MHHLAAFFASSVRTEPGDIKAARINTLTIPLRGSFVFLSTNLAPGAARVIGHHRQAFSGYELFV